MNKLVAFSISITAATLLSSCSTERVNDSEFPVESVLTPTVKSVQLNLGDFSYAA